MKKTIVLALLAGAAALSTVPAHAGVSWSIGINAPVPVYPAYNPYPAYPVYAPAPVPRAYYAPPAVVVQPQVVYPGYPAYYGPAPVVYPRYYHPGWRHGYWHR